MKFYRVLSETEAADIVRIVKDEDWSKGQAASEYAARSVKNNRELYAGHSTVVDELLSDIKNRLVSSPLWNEHFVLQMLVPRFNRYAVGDSYHEHADAGWMGQKFRTDLACTLFLTDDYEGGELCANGMKIKAGAGCAVVYECWRPHEVLPVTRGERICAITWLQSLIREAMNREVLDLLRSVLADLHREEDEGRHYSKLSAVYGKLMRMWMEN